MPTKMMAAERRRRLEIGIGLLPIVILVLTVTIIPSLYAFRMSLFRTKFMNLGAFVGLENFIDFFTDPTAWVDIKNSLVFVVASLAFSIPIGLFLALLLNRPVPGVRLFRSILIIPYVIAQIVIALMFLWLFDPTYGPINYYIETLGLEKVDFVGSTVLAMPFVILANVWRSYPLPLILILSALQTIPEELKEAARIDGANWYHVLIHVILPLISYSIAISAVMLTLQYFTMVTLIFIMTGGGPLRTTETLGVRVFIEGFVSWNLAVAAAVGVVIFLTNGIFAYSYMKVIYREVEM